ncbi:MAG: nodulation protein NfeD [Proteobacteria bacterium]|nr:nodulation protein NfeD [Pseudomonadota bacterium]
MISRTPLALLLVLLGITLAMSGPHAEEGAAAEVWMVSFDGALGPATGDLIIRSIADAQAAGARAIIIQMDTPGGLDKAMRDVVKAILSADIVVITYVYPDGARAASAGTYIVYASHIAAMSPATNIGSSTPVSIAPTPSIPSTQDGDQDKPPPQDAMMKKVVNDAVAYLQGLAELRGRNIEWAEETVREGTNLRASVALEKNIIDLIAKDVPTLLAEIDGREVKLPNRTVTLDVASARVVLVETDWRHELLEVITDPSIAYGLLIFGIYGLILEFYNPGMIFPAVVGVICLLLGAYGLQMLPVNYAGLALMAVGIGMMLGEAFTPTMGVLGVAGVIAFVIGSIILMDSQQPGYEVPLSIIAAFAVTTAGLSLFTIGAAVRMRNLEVVTGKEAMVGKQAEALEDFDQQGWVRAFGETWLAESAEPVKKQAIVKIVAVEGLILKVQPEKG